MRWGQHRPNANYTTKRGRMIVGLSGYAQAGKDTAAQPLIEAGFKHAAFADGVRAMMERVNPTIEFHDPTVFSVDGSMTVKTVGSAKYSLVIAARGYEWVKENTNARDYMVAIGAGVREIIGDDAWVRPVERRLKAAPSESWVITDVRYANEARMIRSLGGVVWQVLRPGVEPANEEERRSLHSFAPDLVLVNDGTITGLQDDISERVRMWKPSGRVDVV